MKKLKILLLVLLAVLILLVAGYALALQFIPINFSMMG
jgi:hypothetical protein